MLMAYVQVLLERHWTRSSCEMTYALLSWASQLLNSTVVLLLVNASGVSTGNSKVDFSRAPSWLQKLILDGKYNDFMPGWYEDVGLSILVSLCGVGVGGRVVYVCVSGGGQ